MVSEKDRQKMVAELENLSNRSYVQDYLNDNYFRFIHDYIELSARTDFSYGSFRYLQMRYLTELYEFAHKQSLNDEQYAFFSEGDTWTIIFDGKALRKLSGGGFKYLHRLVSCPGRPFYTVDLDDTTEDPYKPSDGMHSGSKISASNDEDQDNNDSATDDDNQTEDDQTSHENMDETNEDNFKDGTEIDDGGSYDLNQRNIQQIDTNGAIWISQGKTFERNNLGPVLDNKIMPEAKKLLNEFLKEKKIAEKSGDKKRELEVLNKFKVLRKEVFKYMKRPKNHFGNATETESNRIAQAIRRAIIEIRGSENSPQRELREKVYNHFYLALNFIKTGSQMYMPIDDIKWKFK